MVIIDELYYNRGKLAFQNFCWYHKQCRKIMIFSMNDPEKEIFSTNMNIQQQVN